MQVKYKWIVWVGGVDDYYEDHKEALTAVNRWIDDGYDDVQIEEISTPEGVNLESVGTYIRADGWCFPMTIDGGYFDDEGVAIHIRDCDPEDEGYEWWQNLSPEDRKIAEEAKAKESE